MNNTLKKFYYGFYTPLPMAEFEQEIEDCHQQLIERLEKPERKLVLRIIDAQNLITAERSMDSFLCGFQLAWELAYELNHLEIDRHPSLAEEAEMDGVNPKFCVNSNSGANRAKFIQGGSRGIRLPPCQQHNAGGVGCQGQRSCSACP